MENLIEFQDIQNQNIEILKQQLQDLNVNNTEEEIINTKYKKPRKSKKIVLSSSSDSDKENKEPIEKPKIKCERTVKQKEAFLKACQKMIDNAELRKLERAKNAEQKKQELEERS